MDAKRADPIATSPRLALAPLPPGADIAAMFRLGNFQARPTLVAASLSIVGLLAACTQADAQPPRPMSVSVYFDNNSVWQRDQPVRLRGEGEPGAKVSFASADLGESMAKVSADGTWSMQLAPKPAGGPYSYTLRSGTDQIIVRDVYLGDVFVCSGQSNMEWPVGMTDDGPEAVTKTDDLLHHIMVPHVSVGDRRREPAAGAFWQTAYPGRTEGFTAVGYYFAEQLRAAYPNLAIGLIHVSWGGSRIEAWLPDAAEGPALVEVSAANRQAWDRLRAKYPAAFNDSTRRLPAVAEAPGEPITLGGAWEGYGFPEVDGTMWLDRTFGLSARQLAAGPAILNLGPIDDSDSTYVNGRLVGHTFDKYNASRRYVIPAGVLRAGENRLSVWVEDTGGGGGLTAAPDSVYLETGIGRVALGMAWTVRPERIRYDSLGSPNQVPQRLYNGMLHSLAGVAAKGVLWYQGESNAWTADDAAVYADHIKSLVSTFRTLSGQPDLPFVAVELPEWKPPVDAPYETYGYWPNVRQSTRAILDMPATSTVVAFGYGDAVDIHPRNKKPVGVLLAEDMKRLAYGVTTGPTTARAKSLSQLGQMLVVDFEGAGAGVRASDGESIRGFAVQDAQGAWHHAEADVMDGRRVRVVGPAGKTYRAIAYAWSNNPDEANLVNGYGRPVGSFKLSLEE